MKTKVNVKQRCRFFTYCQTTYISSKIVMKHLLKANIDAKIADDKDNVNILN